MTHASLHRMPPAGLPALSPLTVVCTLRSKQHYKVLQVILDEIKKRHLFDHAEDGLRLFEEQGEMLTGRQSHQWHVRATILAYLRRALAMCWGAQAAYPCVQYVSFLISSSGFKSCVQTSASRKGTNYGTVQPRWPRSLLRSSTPKWDPITSFRRSFICLYLARFEDSSKADKIMQMAQDARLDDEALAVGCVSELLECPLFPFSPPWLLPHVIVMPPVRPGHCRVSILCRPWHAGRQWRGKRVSRLKR